MIVYIDWFGYKDIYLLLWLIRRCKGNKKKICFVKKRILFGIKLEYWEVKIKVCYRKVRKVGGNIIVLLIINLIIDIVKKKKIKFFFSNLF